MKKSLLSVGLLALSVSGMASAADYQVDTAGAHASVNFKIKHLGYSWLQGRFNTFSGQFSYDGAKPDASSVTMKIDTTSLDSNHAERDKHLRSADFLDVKRFPEATFNSTKVVFNDEMNGEITGKLTLHGVTKEITFPIEKIGEGQDPWGGYRAGFSGKTQLALKDFGIDYDLGPASAQVELEFHIEGVRK